MRKYEKYKPSGIEWLGEIPEYWEVKRVKDLFNINPGFKMKSLDKDTQVSFTPMECLRCGQIEKRTIDYATALLYVPFKNNDILMAKVTPCFENGNIAIAEDLEKGIGFGSSEIYVIRSDERYINRKLAFYLFQSIYFRSIGISSMKGTGGLKRVDPITLNTALYPYISLSEQTAIANYLDTKTAAIDRKIELLTAKADKYKALRRSLINETVCRGLNPNASLKDSGIEWIGMIPEHWEVKRLKSLGNIETSSVDKKIIEDESIVKLVNYTDVYGNITKEIWNSDNYMIVSANDKQLKSKKLRQGNVLFTPSSETITDIGVSAVIMEDLENTLYSYHVLRFVFRENVDLLFKKYLLNNDFIQYYFSKSATGTTRKILGLNTFWNLPIILPPLNEQILIGKYLNENTALIDTILTNISEQISKLTQLRKTLINDVVTGKIKVTD